MRSSSPADRGSASACAEADVPPARVQAGAHRGRRAHARVLPPRCWTSAAASVRRGAVPACSATAPPGSAARAAARPTSVREASTGHSVRSRPVRRSPVRARRAPPAQPPDGDRRRRRKPQRQKQRVDLIRWARQARSYSSTCCVSVGAHRATSGCWVARPSLAHAGVSDGSCRCQWPMQVSVAHVPTAESSHSPKLVKATITASIQYWLRTASWASR
jgi:hypothetical protein